jgi:hypothetical protein
MDQSDESLQPRDSQFAEEKAQVEVDDAVSEMRWKKAYWPSSSSGTETGIVPN